MKQSDGVAWFIDTDTLTFAHIGLWSVELNSSFDNQEFKLEFEIDILAACYFGQPNVVS